MHRIDKARDRRFWSARVSRDVRIIVHRDEASLLLCYVGHHDPAYSWAERRRLERHPKTGAAQLVEVRETVREIEVPYYVTPQEPATAQPRPALFADAPDDVLLGYGVPEEWLDDVRAANEDTLLGLADHLPAEAAEALLELATGGAPSVPTPIAAGVDAFEHPDAQRRFRLLTNVEELERALDFPWERWTVFLHPAQRDIVERIYSGPARVAGSAGTGKTVVALHRAVHLARAHPESEVLLTTFNETLASALGVKLGRLVGNEPGVHNRITVAPLDRVGLELFEAADGPPSLADDGTIRELLANASAAAEEHRFSDRFLESEWHEVVDAWQLDSWEAYHDVARLGRRTRLGERQRELLWSIFEYVRRELDDRGLSTLPSLMAAATQHLVRGGRRRYEFVAIDEAQDIGVPQLRFLAALGAGRDDALFFAGDLGQRIFQAPFSWLSLGVDVRGRSHTLRINYRTSHQIRQQADLLLPPELSDVDGNSEERRGTVSAFNGPPPVVRVLPSPEMEIGAIADWIRSRVDDDGLSPSEIAVFVRSDAELRRAAAAIEAAGFQVHQLGPNVSPSEGRVQLGTMHLAKGLEFRAVAVAACDDEVIPAAVAHRSDR